ncbi:MAG: hypothetical protein JSV23_04560 [Promethearchaeota archaeon]|nr:MAG: hypothetical protein JSV23_04560 [Candidatus Lokiarchaeota archaeon]
MKLYSESSLKQFYSEIYHILKETDANVIEIWSEISKIPFLNQFNFTTLRNFLGNFKFVSLRKENYHHYVVINKISFILNTINILQKDIKQISEILNYDGFESLVQEILSINNYITTKNYRFSDKSNFKTKTSQKRYEIDIIGVYLKNVLLIDAKQWKHKDSFSTLDKAANLQYQRTIALKKNPEIFSQLIQKLLGPKLNLKKRLPFVLIPMIVSLEDNSIKINNNQIPLVSIYELNSFLQELQNNFNYFKTIQINKINVQKRIL